MKRFAFEDLREWVNKPRRKPLLLRGARQVGKTWLIDELGNQEFNNYIKIDYEESPGFQSLFDGEFDILISQPKFTSPYICG